MHSHVLFYKTATTLIFPSLIPDARRLLFLGNMVVMGLDGKKGPLPFLQLHLFQQPKVVIVN